MHAFQKLEYTLRGRWRPACFWSLLGRNPGSGRGVPVSFKMFKNSIVFFIQDSISAFKTHKIFKNIKCTQTDTAQIDPVLDHFGAATVAIHENIESTLNYNCSCADPVPEPVQMAVCGVLLDLYVSKSSA